MARAPGVDNQITRSRSMSRTRGTHSKWCKHEFDVAIAIPSTDTAIVDALRSSLWHYPVASTEPRACVTVKRRLWEVCNVLFDLHCTGRSQKVNRGNDTASGLCPPVRTSSPHLGSRCQRHRVTTSLYIALNPQFNEIENRAWIFLLPVTSVPGIRVGGCW